MTKLEVGVPMTYFLLHVFKPISISFSIILELCLKIIFCIDNPCKQMHFCLHFAFLRHCIHSAIDVFLYQPSILMFYSDHFNFKCWVEKVKLFLLRNLKGILVLRNETQKKNISFCYMEHELQCWPFKNVSNNLWG